MRFQSLLFLGVVAAIAATVEAAPARKIVSRGKTNFTSKERRFSVWLPAQRARVSNGLIIFGDLYRPATAPVEFRISAVKKYPRRAAIAGNSLDSHEKRYFTESKMKLQSRQSLQLGGFEGREIRLLSSATPFSRNAQRVRFFDTPEFFYQLLAAGSQSSMQAQAAQITKVFDSFRILPR